MTLMVYLSGSIGGGETSSKASRLYPSSGSYLITTLFMKARPFSNHKHVLRSDVMYEPAEAANADVDVEGPRFMSRGA